MDELACMVSLPGRSELLGRRMWQGRGILEDDGTFCRHGGGPETERWMVRQISSTEDSGYRDKRVAFVVHRRGSASLASLESGRERTQRVQRVETDAIELGGCT